MTSTASTLTNCEPKEKCCYCISFRTGMKLQLAWGVFWMWCWYMTCQFMFTGEYNDFNNGGIVTKSVPIILFCTLLTLIAVVLNATYLYKDTVGSRLGLVVASGTLFVVAVVFVFGGVPIMIIDILAMGYALMKTWQHYKDFDDEDYTELS